MRTLQILRKQRPRSCGRVSSDAYYEWKCYHNQLWRFPEHQVKAEDIPPVDYEALERIDRESNKEHARTRPRKGDLIFQKGEFLGLITYVNQEGVGGIDKTVSPPKFLQFELDWFTDHETRLGRRRWYL